MISYYPMVNGDFTDSWTCMDKSITILNWQMADFTPGDTVLGLWKGSLSHFENTINVHQVVSGFYEMTTGGATGVEERTRKQFAIAKEFHRIVAVCYYSTKRDHRFTNHFFKTADAIWDAAP